MFQHLTGGLDLGTDQVKNTTFFGALSPKGCFVLQAAPPPSEQQRMLTEQEVLALQLQEQAARQQALAYAQQQQPPLQAPQQAQQQVPQSGVDQVKNKRFIRACVSQWIFCSPGCFSETAGTAAGAPAQDTG